MEHDVCITHRNNYKEKVQVQIMIIVNQYVKVLIVFYDECTYVNDYNIIWECLHIHGV